MKRFKMLFGLGIILILSSAAFSAVPQLINFQGILKDGSGNPVVNAPYSVTFTIYNAPTGGINLWSETQAVTTSSGLFSVLLGAATPVPDSAFQDTTHYLGIKVGADPEMTPRQQLVSVAYGFRISSVDGASGGTITSKVSIGPGQINTGTDAFVAGANNRARGEYSVVGGGGGATAIDSNSALGLQSTIGGGRRNTASGIVATVGGGQVNTASGDRATVGGGSNNTASGFNATVGGGTVNTASGQYATVPGGTNNTAAGNYSFAAGLNAKANHSGAFVWGSDEPADFASTGNRQFLIRAAGGVGIGTNSPAGALRVAGGNSIFDGNVGIGTTAPAKALQIGAAGTPNSEGMIRLESRSGTDAAQRNWEIGVPETDGNLSGKGYSFVIDDVQLGTDPEFLVKFGTGNVGIGTTAPAALLHVNGTAGNGTGVWSTVSDRRLKTEIQPIRGALETVEALQGVSFRWKDAKKDAEFGRVRGLIAQDVETVIPEWIKTDPDGFKRLEPIGVDALLIEAIKEQQKQIEELKEKIARLEKTKTQARVE